MADVMAYKSTYIKMVNKLSNLSRKHVLWNSGDCHVIIAWKHA